MNKENKIFLPGPEPFIFINNTECIICKKHFKSSCGLFWHKSIVRKYSEIPADQENIPNFLINKFKENIVYLIHRRLNKKNNGLQTVFLACPVELFKNIFKNHIHFFTKKTGLLKCIFCGPTAYKELADILNNSNWGVKHHSQKQQTYVQLTPSCSQIQENSLIKLRQQKAAKKRSRYPYGEIIIEWKQKKDTDAKGNVCESGFIYIHFFVSRKLFV